MDLWEDFEEKRRGMFCILVFFTWDEILPPDRQIIAMLKCVACEELLDIV